MKTATVILHCLVVLSGCAGEPEPQRIEDRVDGDGLLLSKAALSLVVTRVDPGAGIIRVLNRADQPFDGPIEIRTRRDVVAVPALGPFEARDVAIAVERIDAVMLVAGHSAVGYLEIGAPAEQATHRRFLWTGPPIPSPAEGEAIVLARAIHAGLAISADAYALVARDTAALSSRILDTAREPIEGARIDATCAAGEAYAPADVSDELGAFEVAVPAGVSMCWLRVSAEGYASNVRPFIAGAADLQPIYLAPRGRVAGTRVAPDRIEFAEGAVLVAHPADLDAAGDLYYTFIPASASPVLTLIPGQRVGGAGVHGADPNDHVVFRHDLARLFVPMAIAPAAILEDAPRAVFELRELDLTRPPATASVPSGTVSLTAREAVIAVRRFSETTFAAPVAGYRVRAEEIEGEAQHIPTGGCLCRAQQRTECMFSTQTFEQGQGLELDASTEAEGSFGSAFEHEGEAGTSSVETSLVRKIAASLGASETAGRSFSCGGGSAEPLDCHHMQTGFELMVAVTTLTLEEEQWVRIGLAEAVLEHQDIDGWEAAQHLAWGAFGLSISFGNPIVAAEFAGLAPIYSHRWVEIATGVFKRAIGCGNPVFTYAADYAGCGCSSSSLPNGVVIGHGAASLHDRPAPSTCPGTGVVTHITPPVSVAGASCDASGTAAIDRAAHDEAATLAQRCTLACQSLHADCRGALIGRPAVAMVCTESGSGAAYFARLSQECACSQNGDVIDDLRGCSVPSDCTEEGYACLSRPDDVLSGETPAFACQPCSGDECDEPTSALLFASATVEHPSEAACLASLEGPVASSALLVAYEELLGGAYEACGAPPTALAPSSDGALSRLCEGSYETLVLAAHPICG